MRTEITINGSLDPAAHYLTWTPVQASIRLAESDGATAPVNVRLRNQNPSQGGQLEFSTTLANARSPELLLTLPVDGAPVSFFVAGQFGRPSNADHDAGIAVRATSTNQVLSITPVMVRIRKNANRLTTAERNRFRSALAVLNDRGIGAFSDFRNVHTNAGDPEAHQRAGFLPWHRAFLLDLERELQRIDPSVALPYWRFDEPAPRVFTRAFMGIPERSTAVLSFSADNPLQFWATDSVPGIVRRPQFNAQTEAASRPSPAGRVRVRSEATTLALGGAANRYEWGEPVLRDGFRPRMEENPHGAAHLSFTGFIRQIGTAARDPLFFLLHANVDRLWAKWQWFHGRFAAGPDSYPFLGAATDPGATQIGHNLQDTMWPWNQIIGGQRPPTAPGGTFPSSPVSNAPGLTPMVGSLIDFQGVLSPASRLGFDYDDVPYE